MKIQTVHYCKGTGAKCFITYCGLRIDKTDEAHGWVNMDADIIRAVEGREAVGRRTEQQRVVCEACGKRGAMVALARIEL